MKLIKSKVQFFTDVVPLIITAALILGFGIPLKQDAIKIIPVLISLFINILSANINRWTFILGAINSVIYAIGFFSESLYGTAFQCLLISAPIQIISFFMWKKNTNSKGLKTRRLSRKGLILTILISAALWIGFYFVFKAMNSNQLILDNTVFVLGLVNPILNMCRYIENVFLSPIGQIVNLVLYINMSINNLANITYVFYTVFCIYCLILTLIRWIKLYAAQNGKETNLQPKDKTDVKSAPHNEKNCQSN